MATDLSKSTIEQLENLCYTASLCDEARAELKRRGLGAPVAAKAPEAQPGRPVATPLHSTNRFMRNYRTYEGPRGTPEQWQAQFAGVVNSNAAKTTLRGASSYAVLGLQPDATLAQVKSAYRAAARVAHPDHGGDAATFQRITAAYELLTGAR